MTYPQEARNSCHQCNGWYNSESELYEHMQTVHRRCVPQQGTSPREVTQPNDFDRDLPTPKKDGWSVKR
jgi:hypothetical protein